MVNVFGKKVVSSVLAVLILLSVFLTLPMTAENVNAAVSAPTNLKVTEYSDKAAKLSWSKVAGVTGYLVYYSKDNSNFTKLKTINSQSTTSYTVGGLTAGKAYYFALISYTNINGKITKSERTSSLKITATSSSSVPAPSNLKVAEYSNSAIKLTWTKASDVTGYYVYRSTDGKKYSKIKTLKASTTAYTNTSLTAGQKYYYSIASYKNTSTGAVAIGPK
ncbi:MAG: fibronectin type III domain-containing protein, partial [Clostridium sp.]|nr:fibronectin type III domain-containing protein [Clostridium sp.]